jgi:hypothetical protein
MKNLFQGALMKDFMILLCAVAMVFSVAVTAQAISYTDVVNVGASYGADSGGHIWQGFNTVVYTWQHPTPADFEVPWDTVSSASLSVYVGWVDTFGDDHLDVQSLSLPLTENTATYTLDIGSLFVSLWPNGQNLIASLTIKEDEMAIGHPEWRGDIILGTSTFAMEYANVPEPSALILLGCGLIGIGVFRRISKKS